MEDGKTETCIGKVRQNESESKSYHDIIFDLDINGKSYVITHHRLDDRAVFRIEKDMQVRAVLTYGKLGLPVITSFQFIDFDGRIIAECEEVYQ